MCDTLELGVAVLMPPFGMCQPALSRLVLTMIDRCLQQQLEHQELQGGVEPVGIPSLPNDHSLMLNDQVLVRQSLGPQRDTTAAAVASLVVLATIFIREHMKSPSAARLLPEDQAFALSLSIQVFRCIECVCHDRLGGVAVVLQLPCCSCSVMPVPISWQTPSPNVLY